MKRLRISRAFRYFSFRSNFSWFHIPPIIEPSLIRRNGGRGGGGGAYLLKRQQHTHRILTFKTDRKVLATVTLVPVIKFSNFEMLSKTKNRTNV